jgi:hypothetical protein
VMIFFLKLMLQWEVEMMMMTVIIHLYWENWNNLVILKKKNTTLCLNSYWKGSSVMIFWMADLLKYVSNLSCRAVLKPEAVLFILC